VTPSVASDDALSLTFGALADSTRRTILARLAEGDASVNEIAAMFPHISLQAVSKHLAVLERARLVTRSRSARQRPAHLRTEAIVEANAWLAYYERFYDDTLDRLGEHLARLHQSPPDTETDHESRTHG
jgi:DNA-binding transcriptional ArsR family regulator